MRPAEPESSRTRTCDNCRTVSVSCIAAERGQTGAPRFIGIPPPEWRHSISAWFVEATMRNANAATVSSVDACGTGSNGMLPDGIVREVVRLRRDTTLSKMSPIHLMTCAAPNGWPRADHSAPAPERAYDNSNADRCLAVRRDASRRTTWK